MADCEGDRLAEPPPAGFDAVDLDMIKSGDRLGPALGRRVFDALTRAEERIAEMDAALEPFCFDGLRWLHGNKVAITVATADIERARAIRTRGE